MYIVLPLLPILIALLFIAFGIFGEIQSNIDAINTIVIIAVAITFIGIAIYNLTRDYVTRNKKILSTIACGVLGTISGYVMHYFVSALGAIEFGILGLIEFIFVLIMGGSICLLIVLGCVVACCWFGE